MAAGRSLSELQLALTMHPSTWFRLAIIHRAFHYVNSHPRGDPVYSLLSDFAFVYLQYLVSPRSREAVKT